jgi:hypothetical protein
VFALADVMTEYLHRFADRVERMRPSTIREIL